MNMLRATSALPLAENATPTAGSSRAARPRSQPGMSCLAAEQAAEPRAEPGKRWYWEVGGWARELHHSLPPQRIGTPPCCSQTGGRPSSDQGQQGGVCAQWQLEKLTWGRCLAQWLRCHVGCPHPLSECLGSSASSTSDSSFLVVCLAGSR